jgi:hypothetical protein
MYHTIVQPYVCGAARVPRSRLGTVPRLVVAPCATSDKAHGLDHGVGHPVSFGLAYCASWRTEGSRWYLDSF